MVEVEACLALCKSPQDQIFTSVFSRMNYLVVWFTEGREAEENNNKRFVLIE